MSGNSGDAKDEFNSTNNKAHKYKKPSSHDSRLWHEHKHSRASLLMAASERREADLNEIKKFAEEYDDCDLSVTRDVTSIDEEMRKMGLTKKHGIRKESTLEDDLEEGDDNNDSSATDNSNDERNKHMSGEAPQSPSSLVNESVDEEQGSSDYQTVMRLLEHGEKITHMYRCARIQGLDTTEGLLLFGREHFYVLDGFTLVNGREVHDINFISTTYYEPIIPQVPGQTRPCSKRQVFKHSYEEVKEVHKRRYLLQPIALEVFCFDGQNQFLAFMKDTRSKVYQRYLSVSKSIADSAHSSVAGQRRSANVEQSGGLFSSLMGETSVTQRWCRGEITNFQYLMALNTLAGRTYNDLMQYPIFPWVKSFLDSICTQLACSLDENSDKGTNSDKTKKHFRTSGQGKGWE